MVYQDKGRKDIFTLLHYAKFHRNDQAIKDLLEEAKKQRIFEEVNDKKIISEYLGNNGELVHTLSIVSEDGTVKTKTFKTIEIAADSETITDKDTYTLEGIEEALEECKESLEVKEQKDILHTEATETDIESCEDINKDSEDFQPIFKSSEEVQNTSIDTTVQEPNTPDIPLPTEPCSGSDKENSEGKNPSKKLPQSIVAGIVGAGLLASCIMLYIMKMPVVAVALGIVGLACVGFSLYNLLKPNTKLEKLGDVEKFTAQPLLNPAN